MTKRFEIIDFLKLVLIIAVIGTHAFCSAKWAFFHIAELPLYEYLNTSFKYANNAVEGFFIISGFLLAYSFKEVPLKEFILKKYFRLAPVAIFSIIVCYLCHFLHLIRLRVVGDVLTVFLLNNFGFCFTKGSNQILWFSSALFAGLLLYYSIIKYKPETKIKITAWIILISYLVLEICRGGTYANPYKNILIFNVGFLRAMGSIGIGVLISTLFKKYENCDLKFKFQFFINSILEITLLCGMIYWLFVPHIKITNFIFVIIFTIFFILMLLNKGIISNLLNRIKWSAISKYVYSAYVIHYVIGYLVANFYNINLFFVHKYSAAAILIYFLIVFLASILIYHLVEKPTYKYFTSKL